MDTFFESLPLHAAENDRAMVFLLDNNLVEFSNEKFCQMMRMTRSEVHGLDLRKYTHPDDLAAQQQDIERFINKETETFEANQRMFRKCGAEFWARKVYYRFYNDKGELIYWIIVYTEIPEPKYH